LLSKVLIFLGWATAVSAHEMTPAYPIVKPSHVTGVVKVDLSLFNSREEINYYEIGLYDLNWHRIPFSAVYRIIKVGYKERKNFSVYIRESDLDEAVYVCTTSKIRRQLETKTLISSKICSRLDGMPA
jgi:hypothetical protein